MKRSFTIDYQSENWIRTTLKSLMRRAKHHRSGDSVCVDVSSISRKSIGHRNFEYEVVTGAYEAVMVKDLRKTVGITNSAMF